MRMPLSLDASKLNWRRGPLKISIAPTSNLSVNRRGGNGSTCPVIDETFGQTNLPFPFLDTLKPFEVLNRHDHRDRLPFPMNSHRLLLGGIEQFPEVILRFCGGKCFHGN